MVFGKRKKILLAAFILVTAFVPLALPSGSSVLQLEVLPSIVSVGPSCGSSSGGSVKAGQMSSAIDELIPNLSGSMGGECRLA